MTNKIKNRKKVFIASSQEAYDNKSLVPIINILKKNNFHVFPWKSALHPGDFIVDGILQLTREMDFAICFFGEDIKFESRGKEQYGTALNVLLEYGMFLQKLGKDRVRIIQSGTSHIPSDLGGLIVSNINVGSAQFKQEMERHTKEIVRQWKNIPSIHNDQHGITKPIAAHKRDLDKIIQEISSNKNAKGILKPIEFNEKLIIDLYIQGLENVERRFWTTTYLSSSFWIHKSASIIRANEEMLTRLSQVKNKDIRRLFILRNDPNEEIDILKKRLIDYKSRKDGGVRLRNFVEQFDNLRASCNLLRDLNCELRYASDDQAYHEIAYQMIHDDTEIALYDDFRVDFFDGSKRKKIVGVTINTNLHQDFETVKSSSEKYFLKLWDKGRDIKILLDEFAETFENFERKVDYTLKKILGFDNDIIPADAELKQAEMACVLRFLQTKAYNNKIMQYLDIGTCTGRYPFELRNSFDNNCNIFGIDADPECIEYIKVKKKIIQNAGKNVNNISFHCANFLKNDDKLIEEGKKFDLITCMLGTISHFGWGIDDKSNKYDDQLQFALEKMKLLLSENGLLIISNWTDNGFSNGMLSIYTETDKEFLRSGTERGFRLGKRLDNLSLDYVHELVGTDHELEIFFCKLIS